MTVLVLLPGLDGVGAMFAEFAAALDGRVEVIVLSYPAAPALGYQALEECVRARLPVGRPFVLLGECFSEIGLAACAGASSFHATC